MIVDEFGYAEDTARRFHQDMIYFTYGLAILANTDHLHLTETELREAFRREFRALIAIYGKLYESEGVLFMDRACDLCAAHAAHLTVSIQSFR